MIQVELSNIWSCVSLPDLLGREAELFRAHLRLRSGEADKPCYLGWLGQSDAPTARMLHAVERAADAVRSSCDTLVVVGSCAAADAARAGIRLLADRRGGPQILFTGDHLSSHSWLELCDRLEKRSFCIHLMMHAPTMESLTAARALRWMLERRFGAQAAQRVFVSAAADSPAARMAREEGYTLLPLPEEPGGTSGALTSAMFLPLAAAGVEPLSVLEGAAGAWSDYDLRAFENPVWMYAGARQCLAAAGRTAEMLCTFSPDCAQLGRWWQRFFARSTLRGGVGILPMDVQYPRDMDLYDEALCGGTYPVFETFLRIGTAGDRGVNVEMDWKDYDGLGYLAGKTLADAESAVFEALTERRSASGAPALTLEVPAMTPGVFGELLYFFELSAALCAEMNGLQTFAPQPEGAVRAMAAQLLGRP